MCVEDIALKMRCTSNIIQPSIGVPLQLQPNIARLSLRIVAQPIAVGYFGIGVTRAEVLSARFIIATATPFGSVTELYAQLNSYMDYRSDPFYIGEPLWMFASGSTGYAIETVATPDLMEEVAEYLRQQRRKYGSRK